MIREKIFRLHRHKSSSSFSSAGTDSSGHKFDFTFSNIQALQVPKGWDKLYLSLVSSESGKTVRKSGKAPVRNQTCQWKEILSESIWISDITDNSSKEVGECLLKFLVSMGSSRSSGILGEATLNLAAFLSFESPTLVSMPLKNCKHGTILQVEVRCVTPKMNLRDRKWNTMHGHKDELADHEDTENRSEKSDSTITKSIESCSSNNVANSSRPTELGSRETSFSASVSRYSFDSIDDSNFMGRQDSIGSNDSASQSHCSYSPHGSVKSARTQCKNQREELIKLSPWSLQQNVPSFKEADEATVQELKAEAKTWEQNARKLADDMETLRKDYLSEQSECRKLNQEIGRLRFLLEESASKENVGQSSDLQELMEDEMRFEKESNRDLYLQLQKTQESNIELISILQEMEETIEKQKLEIEGLSANKLELIYTKAKNSYGYEDCSEDCSEVVNVDAQIPANESKRLHDYDSGTSIVSEISVEEDIHEKIGISVLESTLEDRIIETEIEQDLKNRVLREFVLECNRKVQEFEKNCVEHTQENLQLLFELKELRVSCHSGIIEPDSDSFEKEEEIKALSYRFLDNKIDEMRLIEQENNQSELVKHFYELQEENVYLLQRVSGLEAQLRYLTDVKESSRMELQHSEYQVTVLQNRIGMLEGEIESQKLDMNHKLEEIEKKRSEAEEECISVSRMNIKLQFTTESLIEEYNSLQKFNRELREQKLQLQSRCMVSEAKARKFDDFRCNCGEIIGSLEVKYSSLKGEISKFEELESRIRLSEVERLRLADENAILSMKLQKEPELQDEVLALRVSVKEMKSQNQLIEASFDSVSGDNEELKREKQLMVQKIFGLGKALSEAEVCRSKKNALEEKLLRLEGDLIARDASCVQDAEMKNELHRMKIANGQLVMKVKYLENVREELQRRLQRHDEESHRKSNSENEGFIQKQVQVLSKQDRRSRRSLVPAIDYESRIQFLENELVKALKDNDMHKTEIESFEAVASEKPESREATNDAKKERISVLEAELQEIRERYLKISLKYAEVEAQREELVMKLKLSK